MSSLLALQGVTVSRGTATLLRDISWSVRAGENWVVFGPNGAGKTTLLNVATGYLWPNTGNIQLLGETLGEVELALLRKRVAIVSEPLRMMINENLSGTEVLITGARAHLNIFDPPTDSEKKRAAEVAQLTGTTTLMNKTFGILSTGERQRILIARALMNEPKLVILDEPCAGLDLAGREFVLSTIRAVAWAPSSPSLLLTTHHVEEITDVFTHIVMLRNGEVFDAGTLEDVLTSENLTELFGMNIDVNGTNGRWNATAGMELAPPAAQQPRQFTTQASRFPTLRRNPASDSSPITSDDF